MTAAAADAPPPAPRDALDRPDERPVLVRYFRIDFDRCVIQKGQRVRQTGEARLPDAPR